MSLQLTICPHAVDLTLRPCALCDRASNNAEHDPTTCVTTFLASSRAESLLAGEIDRHWLFRVEGDDFGCSAGDWLFRAEDVIEGQRVPEFSGHIAQAALASLLEEMKR